LWWRTLEDEFTSSHPSFKIIIIVIVVVIIIMDLYSAYYIKEQRCYSKN